MNYSNSGHDVSGPLLSLIEGLREDLDVSVMSNIQMDILELNKRVAYRGIGTALVDLPKLGKLYDQYLSTGVKPDIEDIPRGLRKKGGYLFEELFDLCVSLSNPDRQKVRFRVTTVRSFFYLFKKVKIDCPEVAVINSHHQFFETDAGLRSPTLSWNSDSLDIGRRLFFRDSSDPSSRDYSLLDLLDLAAEWVIPLNEVSIDGLTGRHGPGRVSDLPSGEDKYSFPSWSVRLSKRFPASSMITHWGEVESSCDDTWGDEPYAKLIAVPKTYDKPRLIASEPTSNQWCQQALLSWLRRNGTYVSNHMIDFFNQGLSQTWALRASVTNRMATVDLSEASDRLSCWTVERAFGANPDLLEALWACRTSTVKSELVGRATELRKFAAQGSAVTFPVQSLVYSMAALAATLKARFGSRMELVNSYMAEYREFGRLDRAGLASYAIGVLRNEELLPRIFGDDIIVAVDAYDNLATIFNLLQLKINESKTFRDGPFRESCGMDAYGGLDVTPIYLSNIGLDRSSLYGIASWVSVRNNAYLKGYTRLAAWMVNQIPPKLLKLIPCMSDTERMLPGVTLLYSGLHNINVLGPIRWNKTLHRWETKMICVLDRSEVQERMGWANLLQFFTEAPATSKSTLEAAELIRDGQLGFVDQRLITVVMRWAPF